MELSYNFGAYLTHHDLATIVCLRGPVPYQESLARVASADATILLQPGTKTEVPSKLYEYVGLGKPTLPSLRRKAR